MNKDCHIVHNGRRINVGAWGGQQPRRNETQPYRGNNVSVRADGVVVAMYCNRKKPLARFLDDLGLIQEHFGGLSRSAAARIAVALTANAIRKNKALPDVNDAV
jgi:hypothetical protein